MRRCSALLAFLAVCIFGFAQAPLGLPEKPNTGDPILDAQTYEQAKQEWARQNQPLGQTPGAGANAAQQPVLPQAVVNSNSELAKTNAAIAATAEPQDRAELRAENERRALQREFALHKDEWFANDPARFQAAQEALGIAPTVNVSHIPQSEFNTYSAEKQAYLLANPNLFVITPN